MPVNSNYGATWKGVNDKFAPNGIGTDNPGQQTCPNCNKIVVPRSTNGLVHENNGAKNNFKAGMPTGAGYHCTSCGHNFTWVKSTGKAGGPVFVDNTNQTGVADM